MNTPKDDKTQLDELIKAYNEIKKHNGNTANTDKPQQTGKYQPIPLPNYTPANQTGNQKKG